MNALICPICWEPVDGITPLTDRLVLKNGHQSSGPFALRPCGHEMQSLLSTSVCRADGCTRTLVVVP